MKKLILIALFASSVANAGVAFIEDTEDDTVGVECVDKDGIKYHDISGKCGTGSTLPQFKEPKETVKPKQENKNEIVKLFDSVFGE